MSDRDENSYDYIIVGAGSAGCALAYRLSREASRRVLLLEAGGRDSLPMIHIPLGFAFLMKNEKVNWCYETEPEVNMHGRTLSWPRGQVLGGSRSINGMVYIRGQQQDYDNWAAMGNKGWSYQEVLPYFKRSQHRAEGANEYHGYGGPLWVEGVANSDKLELADLFIQAGVQTGLPYNDDFNGASQEGAGYYQLNIRNGSGSPISAAESCRVEEVDRCVDHVVEFGLGDAGGTGERDDAIPDAAAHRHGRLWCVAVRRLEMYRHPERSDVDLVVVHVCAERRAEFVIVAGVEDAGEPEGAGPRGWRREG